VEGWGRWRWRVGAVGGGGLGLLEVEGWGGWWWRWRVGAVGAPGGHVLDVPLLHVSPLVDTYCNELLVGRIL